MRPAASNLPSARSIDRSASIDAGTTSVRPSRRRLLECGERRLFELRRRNGSRIRRCRKPFQRSRRKRVAHEKPANDRRRVRQRPADDADRDTTRAQNLQSGRARSVADDAVPPISKPNRTRLVGETVIGQQLDRVSARRARCKRWPTGCRFSAAASRSRPRPRPFRPTSDERSRCRITAPASRIRPKFGSRPSAVALVMKSSDPRRAR